MQIIVEIIPGGKRLTLDVASTDNISSVKAKIKETEGIPIEQQALYSDNRLLHGADILEHCGVKNDDTLRLVKLEGLVQEDASFYKEEISMPMLGQQYPQDATLSFHFYDSGESNWWHGMHRSMARTDLGFQAKTRLSRVEFPTFNGDDLEEYWVFRCERFFDLDRTPEEARANLASVHLEGHQVFARAVCITRKIYQEVRNSGR
ncbi:hypothetical protein POTOM_024761 [Populus tomentosa]|uniref:Ubiquitin-like domain-containing protein n=1 Tax=Populus tomentosa TaxID=118781 RepID=A0A8X8CWJ8_POPTO|nr:hypothetical protein POTOM_024761 [Populus tomentosa]